MIHIRGNNLVVAKKDDVCIIQIEEKGKQEMLWNRYIVFAHTWKDFHVIIRHTDKYLL